MLSRSEIDRLGERLRQEVRDVDLTLLDTYRRSFRPAYEQVIGRIRSELGVQVSGRPAKSTTAIVDKLWRGSMRLSQMQDIAGCRIVVPDICGPNFRRKSLTVWVSKQNMEVAQSTFKKP